MLTSVEEEVNESCLKEEESQRSNDYRIPILNLITYEVDSAVRVLVREEDLGDIAEDSNALEEVLREEHRDHREEPEEACKCEVTTLPLLSVNDEEFGQVNSKAGHVAKDYYPQSEEQSKEKSR